MRKRWASILIVSIALAGCSGIPTDGPVEPGSIIDDQGIIDVAFDPRGPQAGATQAEIVEGFIVAATNPSDGYAVAKLFLTEQFREEWDPDEITQIRSGIGQTRSETDTTYTYTLTSSAHVNAFGQYIEDSPATQVLSFQLVQDAAGEWRIASAPNGIVLSRESFNSVFEARPLYFFDPSNSYLVPDLRWFPKTSRIATNVVRQLLNGQSSWLQQGVTNTYFPAGTKLVSSVTIDSGVATVALSEEVLTATADELSFMRQQLRDSIGNVSSVVITVNGVELDEQDGGPAPATSNLTVEGQPLARAGEDFGYLTNNDTVNAISGLSGTLVELGATDATMLRDRSALAVLTPSGVWRVPTDGKDATQLDRRAGVIAPTADNAGYIWTVTGADASAIIAYDAKGGAHAVSSPQFSGMQAISFAISRDGARALLLANTGLGPRLFVMGIIRADGVPTQLGAPQELTIEQNSRVLDATWIDDNSVAVLRIPAGDELSQVSRYTLGGASASIGRVDGGVAIVGGNGGTDGLRVVSDDGSVFQPRGSGWASTGARVDFLATQQ